MRRVFRWRYTCIISIIALHSVRPPASNLGTSQQMELVDSSPPHTLTSEFRPISAPVLCLCTFQSDHLPTFIFSPFLFIYRKHALFNYSLDAELIEYTNTYSMISIDFRAVCLAMLDLLTMIPSFFRIVFTAFNFNLVPPHPRAPSPCVNCLPLLYLCLLNSLIFNHCITHYISLLVEYYRPWSNVLIPVR